MKKESEIIENKPETIKQIATELLVPYGYGGYIGIPADNLQLVFRDEEKFNDVYSLIKELAFGNTTKENLAKLSNLIGDKREFRKGFSPGEKWNDFMQRCKESIEMTPNQEPRLTDDVYAKLILLNKQLRLSKSCISHD